MTTRQNLAILFFLKRSKIDSNRKIPIYVRITIDGLREQISTGFKVLDEDWDNDAKQVRSADKDHKQTNKTLAQIKADLERHFDLVQAKNGFATPVSVLESYRPPINGAQLNNEKVENLAFSQALDDLIDRYIKFCKKHKKAILHLSPLSMLLAEIIISILRKTCGD
jgi:hypothetical protein